MSIHWVNLESTVHVQRFQTRDSMFGRNYTCDEWKGSTSCLTKPRNPANRACKKPLRQNTSSLIHRNGIHRSKNHSDNGDCNSSSYEGWHKPDYEFESTRASVKTTLANTQFILPYGEKAVNEQDPTFTDLWSSRESKTPGNHNVSLFYWSRGARCAQA